MMLEYFMEDLPQEEQIFRINYNTNATEYYCSLNDTVLLGPVSLIDILASILDSTFFPIFEAASQENFYNLLVEVANAEENPDSWSSAKTSDYLMVGIDTTGYTMRLCKVDQANRRINAYCLRDANVAEIINLPVVINPLIYFEKPFGPKTTLTTAEFIKCIVSSLSLKYRKGLYEQKCSR